MKTTKRRTPSLMTNARQRLAFVLQFAALDLRAPRSSWEWEKLHEELRDFLLPTQACLRPGGLHLWPTLGTMPEQYTVADCVALQADVRELLQRTMTARDQGQAPRYQPLRTLAFAAPHTSTELGGHFMSVQGSTRDLFLIAVLWLLAHINTASLTRCSVCDTVFVRKSNQAYCSRACTNYVSQQRWRDRHGAAEAGVVH
jgi:hypothetical protein